MDIGRHRKSLKELQQERYMLSNGEQYSAERMNDDLDEHCQCDKVPYVTPNKEQVGGDHYKSFGDLQPWDLWTMLKLDPFQALILKYLLRWNKKHPTPEKMREDLEKMRHAVEKYISVCEEYMPKGKK